jgi:hypothetical protein
MPEIHEIDKRLVAAEGTIRWMRWLWMTLGTAIITAVVGALVTYFASAARGADDPARPWNDGLVAAGRVFPGARVFEGQPDPQLQAFAREHAEYQARTQQQGHQRWETRFHAISKAMGNRPPTEICAESWPWEKDAAPETVGRSMFQAWRQSPGHWRVASTPSLQYGAAMARGRNGIWYATIIVVY